MNVIEGITLLSSDKPTAEAEKVVFQECLLIAKAYLRTKKNHFLTKTMQLSDDDLATDLIAELFRRNDDGIFVEFANYFSTHIESQKPFETEIMLRRRVFTEVNDRWFDLFKSWDPVLARFVRMIKYHFKKDERFSLNYSGKTLWIQYKGGFNSKRIWNEEEILFSLCTVQKKILAIKNLPEIVIEMCKQQEESISHVFSIIDIAMSYRNSVSLLENKYEETIEEGDDSSSLDEILQLYEQSKTEIAEFIETKYVQTGKVFEDTSQLYLKIIDSTIYNHFFSDKAEKNSYRETFEIMFPEEEHTKYMCTHRSAIEYLGRLLKQLFLKKVKSFWDIQQTLLV